MAGIGIFIIEARTPPSVRASMMNQSRSTGKGAWFSPKAALSSGLASRARRDFF